MGQTDFVHFAKFGDFTKGIRLLFPQISYCISLFNFPSLLVGIIPAYVNRTVDQNSLSRSSFMAPAPIRALCVGGGSPF
jgi:uncharacterized membrane protein